MVIWYDMKVPPCAKYEDGSVLVYHLLKENRECVGVVRDLHLQGVTLLTVPVAIVVL